MFEKIYGRDRLSHSVHERKINETKVCWQGQNIRLCPLLTCEPLDFIRLFRLEGKENSNKKRSKGYSKELRLTTLPAKNPNFTFPGPLGHALDVLTAGYMLPKRAYTELDKIQSYWKRSVFTLSFIIIHRMLEDQSNYAPVIWNPTTPGSQWSSLSPEQKYWVKSRLLVLSCINQSPLSRIGCDSLDLEVHF